MCKQLILCAFFLLLINGCVSTVPLTSEAETKRKCEFSKLSMSIGCEITTTPIVNEKQAGADWLLKCVGIARRNGLPEALVRSDCERYWAWNEVGQCSAYRTGDQGLANIICEYRNCLERHALDRTRILAICEPKADFALRLVAASGSARDAGSRVEDLKVEDRENIKTSSGSRTGAIATPSPESGNNQVAGYEFDIPIDVVNLFVFLQEYRGNQALTNTIAKGPYTPSTFRHDFGLLSIRARELNRALILTAQDTRGSWAAAGRIRFKGRPLPAVDKPYWNSGTQDFALGKEVPL